MKIGVTAITGKMGRVIANLVMQDNIAELSAGLVRVNSGYDNIDLGELLGFEALNKFSTSDIAGFLNNCQAVIDFSTPALSLEIAKFCAHHKKILVCGTTGFSEEEKKIFSEYGKQTVIIWSANMSLGVNLLMNLFCCILFSKDYISFKYISVYKFYVVDRSNSCFYNWFLFLIVVFDSKKLFIDFI